MNNMALTRIRREYDMIKNYPNENFTANPIKDDLFTWHFTIRGPDDSEFEGGIYHGVIKLPTSYPLKPPSIMFLTPNGRFDTNMDVCLSFTKYHKEEWQAAWTISTMLNAIISFFPIKENHDSIGSIDYPVEIRRKFAQSSKKWKCDQCGAITSLLPEKKPKSENIPEKENEPAINTSEKEEKDDMSGTSDISSPINRAADAHSTEGRSVKKDKTTPKLKKLELDKKSHISNIIEGVIFEDMNEDEEECEKNLENMRSHNEEINSNLFLKSKEITNLDKDNTHDHITIKTNLKTTLLNDKNKNGNNQTTITSDNNNRNKLLKDNTNEKSNRNSENCLNKKEIDDDNSLNFRRHHSDINHSGNFSEYFKKLRQSQFEAEKTINENKSNTKQFPKKQEINEFKEINIPSPNFDEDKYFQSDFTKMKNKSITKEEKKSYEASSRNLIEEMFMEEYEYTNVIKSMKNHKSKSNEEIMKELLQNSEMEGLRREDKRKYLKSILGNLINKNTQQETNKTDKDLINYKKLNDLNSTDLDYMVSFLELSKSKEKLDALYKQKNNYLKYLTRSKYKTAKKKRLGYLNMTMVILIALIFAIYYYCRNYL